MHVQTAQTVFYFVRGAKFHSPLCHAFATSTSDMYMHETEHIPQNIAVNALIFSVHGSQLKK